MSSRRTSGRSRKFVISVLLAGSGLPGDDGRPVLHGGPDVRKMPVVRWVGVNARSEIRGAILGGKNGVLRVKIDEISWMKDGETWGNARSTRNQANPWIKINKTSSNQQITKKIGAIFGGDF